MKTALYIIGTLLGVGVVIYIVKMFSGKPTAQPNQVANTNTASALDPFYRLFGMQRTPASTGSKTDNTGQIITAGAGALTSVSKTFADLFRGTPMTTGVSGVGTPNAPIGNGLTYTPAVNNVESFDYSIFE